jgi:chemotaxis protein methyltransferase CheR
MILGRTSFETVRKLVYERAGIVLDDSKGYLVESRLELLAHARGVSLDDLCRELAKGPEALRVAVVEAMTINETSFFRDHHPFEALQQLVLPQLIERRASQRQLRIWCAACSTGQEPYSIAMLLDEHFPQLARWDVQLLATDIASSVLQRARAGRYSELEVNRGLRPCDRDRYFVRDGASWQLAERLRSRVTFRELNLVASWPQMQPFDLVLLRNVLIYFDASTKRRLLRRIHRQLASDGWLMIGGSETIAADTSSFEKLPVPRAGLLRPTRLSMLNEVG